ncbi:MAG: hypothetical protein M1817_001769 [Caeruleum heppii]|nr:MAG: hypothetical protein M1817_001769 [Caeruleum heppii]
MEEKRWGICYEGRDQPVFNKLHALNQSYVDEAIDFLAYFTLTPDATPWAGQGTVQDRNGMIASAALDSPHVRMTMDSAKIIMTCLLHLQGSGWHELLEGGPLRITPIRAAITGFQMGGEAITYYGFDGNPWANQAPGPTFTESQLYAAGGMRVHVLQRYTAAQDGRQFPFELQIGMEYLYGLPYGNRTLGGPDNSATPYVYVVHVGDRDLTVITDGHTTTNSTEQQRLDAPLLFSWGADSWNTSDAIRCPYHSKWRKEGRQSLTREIGCWANHLKWSGEEAAD